MIHQLLLYNDLFVPSSTKDRSKMDWCVSLDLSEASGTKDRGQKARIRLLHPAKEGKIDEAMIHPLPTKE
jgi:hypothetical protein